MPYLIHCVLYEKRQVLAPDEALDKLDIADPKSGSISLKVCLRVDALPDVLCAL